MPLRGPIRWVAALAGAFDRAADDHVTVILTGREGVFSAGFDLHTLAVGGDDAYRMVRAGFELAARLLAFPTPVVVACTGHALAMGAFLLLAGDHRLGAPGPYKIGATEVALGITMPHFGIEICRQRLVPAYFHRTVINAEVYGPEEAVAAGFLDRMVAGDGLPARGMADGGGAGHARCQRACGHQAPGARAGVEGGPRGHRGRCGDVRARCGVSDGSCAHAEGQTTYAGAARPVVAGGDHDPHPRRGCCVHHPSRRQPGKDIGPRRLRALRDKSGLVREIFFEGFRLLRQRFDELADSADPQADLVRVIEVFRTFMHDLPVLAEVMFSRPFADFDPGPLEDQAGSAVRHFVVGHVQRCVDAGVLAGGATDIAHVLVSMAQGLAVTERAGWLGRSEASVDRRWGLAVRAVLEGMRPRPG